MADTTGFVEALKKIRADPAQAQQFLQDPHGTLAQHGVHVGKSASAAKGDLAAPGVCVGACVCVG